MQLPTNAVKAIILNDKNEILLLQRNPKRSVVDNWDFPGGLIEEGEKEDDALIREVKEELNVDINIINKGKTWKFLRPKDNKWVKVQNYICKIINGNITLSDEHINFRWVNKSDIKTYHVKDESFYESIS